MSIVCKAWCLLCLAFVMSSVCNVQCLLRLEYFYILCYCFYCLLCIAIVMSSVCLSRICYILCFLCLAFIKPSICYGLGFTWQGFIMSRVCHVKCLFSLVIVYLGSVMSVSACHNTNLRYLDKRLNFFQFLMYNLALDFLENNFLST